MIHQKREKIEATMAASNFQAMNQKWLITKYAASKLNDSLALMCSKASHGPIYVTHRLWLYLRGKMGQVQFRKGRQTWQKPQFAINSKNIRQDSCID